MWLTFLALVLLTTGCRSMLPTDDTRTLNQWQNFDEAQASFDKVMPHQTTAEELFKMGWNPKTTPNVKILTYLDLIEPISEQEANRPGIVSLFGVELEVASNQQ